MFAIESIQLEDEAMSFGQCNSGFVVSSTNKKRSAQKNGLEIMRNVIIHRSHVLVTLLAVIALTTVSGCIRRANNEVVVYCALDREFSQPILSDIGKELGMTVLPKFDQESNKTVGLVTGIIQNKARPQCDVFWNNEIMHTLRLEKLGLLEVYRSPRADQLPQQFVSSQNQWHGLAARARVLIVNTDLLPDPQERPTSIYDLADPKWKGRCAMARPLFGTTATHAAVLLSELGQQPAMELLSKIASNAKIEGGNKQVAIKGARGQYAFGITDTDDAIIELENANPVAIVFPDQADQQMGALLIPNTLAVIKNGPNPERAKLLVARLLEADVESRLAAGASAQIPVNTTVKDKSRVEKSLGSTGVLKVMAADFDSAADAWETSVAKLMELFPTGG